MLKKTLTSLLILVCVLVLPMLAQPAPLAMQAIQTMGTNPAASAPRHSSTYGYATRLAALLADTQGRATLSAASWKAIANESNSLANKLYASARGKSRTAARDVRTHVREMHKAAMKGDADGAKSHAAMALPYVYQVIDATNGR
jgi:hypothetical protein